MTYSSDQPAVSVRLMTYNHADYIAEAIESCLMQKTDFDFEIVIGDDYSNDGTKEICERYAKENPDKIRLLERKVGDDYWNKRQKLGRLYNFVNILENCRGKYIALCEGDDYWTDPLKLQKQVDFLEENSDFAICFHQAFSKFENGQTKLFNQFVEDKVFELKNIIVQNYISTASCVFRNNRFSIPSWFYKLPVGDWPLHILNAQFGRIQYLNDCMSVYRIHDKGIWMGLENEERLKYGIEVLETLNSSLEFKYNLYFEEAIRIRKASLLSTSNNNIKQTKYWKAKNWLKKKINAMSKLKEDNFMNIPFTSENLDLYIVRKSILRALNWGLAQMHGKLLDVGCGKMPYRQHILQKTDITEYIGVDIESEIGYHQKVMPDHFWDGKTLPFQNNSYDSIFCTEVLEHVPDTLSFLKESYRVLKPGGIFFFTTPFLWPLHDVPYDEYRLTPFSMKRFLNDAGFGEIEIRPLGGWHASLAQLLGLWVRRAPLGVIKRKLFSLLVKPVIKYLLKKDNHITKEFKSGNMFTGFYGICKK